MYDLHLRKLDAAMPVPRFAQHFQLAPDGLDFFWRVVRGVVALPGQNFHEVRFAGVVFASHNQVGTVEHQSGAPVAGPRLSVNCGKLSLFSCPDEITVSGSSAALQTARLTMQKSISTLMDRRVSELKRKFFFNLAKKGRRRFHRRPFLR
jgi:hypothetical protein